MKHFNYERVDTGKKRKKKMILDCLCAFDIETSVVNIRKKDGVICNDIIEDHHQGKVTTEDFKNDYSQQAFMYIWQFQLGFDITIYGRTWTEFSIFIKKLVSAIKPNEKLIILVHNLSYEFTWLKNMYSFENSEVFCIDARKILKCTMFEGRLEFRCSYLHSNMSLSRYTEQFPIKHPKLSDFVYEELRTPYTELTEDELAYCFNDVRGLVEAYDYEMRMDGDNLYTIPYTSTGYVRRDARAALKYCNLGPLMPDMFVQMILKEAFRGGNTHANRYYSGHILEDVKSDDRSSSYPDVQVNGLYPMTKFKMLDDMNYNDIMDILDKGYKAILCRACFTNIRLKDSSWGCPYIPINKVRYLRLPVRDNGRVLEAAYLEMSLTDIDLRIILQEYDFDDLRFQVVFTARYGRLPQELVNTTISYYVGKTSLKGIPEKEYYYGKSKNKLNAIYGMSAQDYTKQNILFDLGLYDLDTDKPYFKRVEEAKKRAVMPYTFGCWVTARARLMLEDAMRIVHNTKGAHFVYCDTDSVKYIGEVDFTSYNKERIADSTKNNAFAVDAKGKTHYMGVLERDGNYTKFCTLGAKKYLYEEDGELHATIAGVNKKKAPEELIKKSKDPFKTFSDCQYSVLEFTFIEAGGKTIVYNDHPDFTEIYIDGLPIKIYPNAAILPDTYKLGIASDYDKLLRKIAVDES